MPDFSLTDAAFEGFRFTRERPASVAAWAAATFVFNLVTGVLGALVGGDALRAFQAAASTSDASQILPLLLPAAPALAVTILSELAGASVVYASALRSFMGIDRKVTFRVGADERRLFLLLVGCGIFYWVVTIPAGILFGLIVNIAEAFSPPVANFLTERAGPVILFCAPLFLLVRLSLTPVIAVDRKRINVKESWVSTKGHFWPLAGSLILSILLFLLVAFVAMMLVMILTELASIGTHGAMPRPGALFSPDATAWPAVVFGEIVAAICIGLLLPVVAGPLVRAYQAYDAPDPAPVFGVKA
ncbi:MAG TPA: hypothetical protein VMU59_00225 [Caulobacteraceae bacterium]|nr:hypothetical protein [Caulobacteraceae bacterium]